MARATTFPVILNVYDLIDNTYFYPLGVGAYHSGVEVHGSEYSFGGHEWDMTGVFDVEPTTAYGIPLRVSLPIGHTSLSKRDFDALIEKMQKEYIGNQYHVLRKNCNVFSADLVNRLTGKKVPGWINRLAYMGTFVECLLPRQFIGGPGVDASNEESEANVEMMGLAPSAPFSGSGRTLGNSSSSASSSNETAAASAAQATSVSHFFASAAAVSPSASSAVSSSPSIPTVYAATASPDDVDLSIEQGPILRRINSNSSNNSASGGNDEVAEKRRAMAEAAMRRYIASQQQAQAEAN